MVSHDKKLAWSESVDLAVFFGVSGSEMGEQQVKVRNLASVRFPSKAVCGFYFAAAKRRTVRKGADTVIETRWSKISPRTYVGRKMTLGQVREECGEEAYKDFVKCGSTGAVDVTGNGGLIYPLGKGETVINPAQMEV